MTGPYCAACGQRQTDLDALTARALVGEFFSRAAELDFKTIRTLASLFRPGWLTNEYLEGRRRPYLSPIKLYLLCAAIFFLAAPVAGFTLESLTARDDTGALGKLVTAQMTRRGTDPALFAERFNGRFKTVYTLGLSLSVAGAAALLALLFRGRRMPIGAHVVFGLNYIAFVFLIAVPLNALAFRVQIPPAVAFVLTYGVIAPYLVLALRRVYKEPLGRTILKTVVLALLTFVIDTVVNLAAFVVTLRLA